MSKSFKGKVGFVRNSDLDIPKRGGHYVLIEEKKGNVASVHVITSLGTYDNVKQRINIPKRKQKRLYRVAKGEYYAIPAKETDLPYWSAIHSDAKIVPFKSINRIGCHRINAKNMFRVGKK